jgi:hypothetical protein
MKKRCGDYMKRHGGFFNSKESVIKTLSSEFKGDTPKNTLIVIVEYRRLSRGDFVTKVEFIQNDKAKLCGAATQAIDGLSADSIDFGRMRIGESRFQGYLLKYDEPKLAEIVKESVKNWFMQGKMPFLH